MSKKNIYLMENVIQDYAWGSADWIPDLLGFENKYSVPQAELWMGAHPRAASQLVLEEGTKSLQKMIEQAPEVFLGPECEKRYQGLPFLFKVLAAASPLSIQCHPSLEQAKAGFAEEEENGPPLSSPQRNYKDANHKPEIICALSDFTALNGFRSPQEILSGLEMLELSLLQPLLVLLGKEPKGLERFYQNLLSLPRKAKDELCKAAVEKCSQLKDERALWLLKLAKKYPSDMGIFSPFLLNLISLKPGEAMYLPARQLHAYLHGLGIELMANSDNVLRGGLTSKHVDIPELLKVLKFEAVQPQVLLPLEKEKGAFSYTCPAEEFNLDFINLDDQKEISLAVQGPEILFCQQGQCTLSEENGYSLSIKQGQSLFAAYQAKKIYYKGKAKLYRAYYKNLL